MPPLKTSECGRVCEAGAILRFQWLIEADPIRVPLLFISGATLLAQQVTGTISGYVTDPSGAAIPGSTVTATQVQQRFIRTVTSDEGGFYNFLVMPPGPYSVVAEKAAATASPLNTHTESEKG